MNINFKMDEIIKKVVAPLEMAVFGGVGRDLRD
jgi:hypothetical protein